jgi:hypothetical protein
VRDPEIEPLWDAFHQVVNMSSEELRTWLLVDAANEDAFPAEPDLGLPELGRRVVNVLRKRKVDLTDADLATMREVVDFVEKQQIAPPAAEADNARWRRSLMNVGHDPLKP